MESIIYELRYNDVKEEDIKTIMQRVKNRISEENIDNELVKLGYAKIFTVDYNDIDYDEDMDYDEDYDEYKGHKGFDED